MFKFLLVTAFSFLVATSSFASPKYTYKCNDLAKNEYPLTLVFSGAKVSLSEEGFKSSGKVDPNYSPRSPKYKTYNRYVGFEGAEGSYELYAEKSLTKGGKTMRSGSKGGFVQTRWWAEGGYGQVEYVCFRTN